MTMTDSSIPLALQPDALSPPVVTRLAKLPNKVVTRWPVTVHSRQRQALMVLEDGIAIVCDNLTYRTMEPDAFSRVTFRDDTHASVRLPLRTVEVEFTNAAEAQQFHTAVTARAATVPAAGQVVGVPLGAPSGSRPSLAWPILLGLIGAWVAHRRLRRVDANADVMRYWIAAIISTLVTLTASVVLPAAVFALMLNSAS